jgi:hypothetical protein
MDCFLQANRNDDASRICSQKLEKPWRLKSRQAAKGHHGLESSVRPE